jgi:hypothetical protein
MKVTQGQDFALTLGICLFLMSPSSQAQEPDSLGERVRKLQSRMSTLSETAAPIRDRSDILVVSQRFMRGADRHDKELARSAFWPEATVNYGTPMQRDAFIEWDEERLGRFAAHQHHITGQTVEVAGNVAHVESYVIALLVPRDKSVDKAGDKKPGKALTSEKSRIGSGRFVDRWERRDGEWRVIVREYIEDLALLGETVDSCSTRRCLGTWDKTDPSYARPLNSSSEADTVAR